MPSISKAEYQRKWRFSNPEKYRNQWLRNNKSVTNRNLDLFKQYGITLLEYNDIFTKQNGMCRICGIHQSQLPKSLHVDHCHKTNKVRGLLCKKCNSLLGFANDNMTILKNAITYLELA